MNSQQIRQDEPLSLYDDVRQRNKVRIKTQVSKKDVEFRNEFPIEDQERKIFKYSCPICLRYFNKMLVSSCCQNYICRFCIGDMAKRAKKEKQFIIKCSHCFSDDFKLDDVKPEDQVKFYSDTPFKFLQLDHKLTSNSSTHLSPMLKQNLNRKLSEEEKQENGSLPKISLRVQYQKSSQDHQKQQILPSDNFQKNKQKAQVLPQEIKEESKIMEESKDYSDSIVVESHKQEREEAKTAQISADKNAIISKNSRVPTQNIPQPLGNPSPSMIIQSNNEYIIEYAKDELQDKLHQSSFDMRQNHKQLDFFKVKQKESLHQSPNTDGSSAVTHKQQINSIFKSLGKQLTVSDQHNLSSTGLQTCMKNANSAKAVSFKGQQCDSNKENQAINGQDYLFQNITTPVLTNKMKVRILQLQKRASIQSENKVDIKGLAQNNDLTQEVQKEYYQLFKQRKSSTPFSERIVLSGKVKLRKSDLILHPKYLQQLQNSSGSGNQQNQILAEKALSYKQLQLEQKKLEEGEIPPFEVVYNNDINQ